MRLGNKNLLIVFAAALMLLTSGLFQYSFAAAGEQTIDTSMLHAMVVKNAYRIEAGQKMKFTIIDARSPEEYREAHVFSAVNVPERDFEKSQRSLPVDKDVLLVVYCNDKQCVRSRRWAAKAAAAGYTNIVSYSDGFPVWRKQHFPVAP